MTTKAEAAEVFRQFAWSLAGKLAAPESGQGKPKRRPAKPREK